ncbi:hypothetical protein PQI66_03090 [Corynebacterium sp. USCH3]|uniref:hypothetical protein n=1 Tax=Corynebacterium sp. USCH3 TaxID=3024840 RepID=UPI0030B7D551
MLHSEHDPLRTFDTLEDVVTKCVIPSLRDEGLDPEDYNPVGIALSVSEKIDGKWVAQTIRLRDAKWWHLLPEDPVKRLVEHARIDDEAPTVTPAMRTRRRGRVRQPRPLLALVSAYTGSVPQSASMGLETPYRYYRNPTYSERRSPTPACSP